MEYLLLRPVDACRCTRFMLNPTSFHSLGLLYPKFIWSQTKPVPQSSDFVTVLIEFLSHTISRTYGKTFGQVLWTPISGCSPTLPQPTQTHFSQA
jgi:hypothetical protein